MESKGKAPTARQIDHATRRLVKWMAYTDNKLELEGLMISLKRFSEIKESRSFRKPE